MRWLIELYGSIFQTLRSSKHDKQARVESEAMEAALSAFRRRYPKISSLQVERLEDSLPAEPDDDFLPREQLRLGRSKSKML